MAITKMTPLTATTAATGPMKAQMNPVSGSSQQWCGVPYLYSTVQYSTVQYSAVQYSTVPAEVQRLVAEDGEGDHQEGQPVAQGVVEVDAALAGLPHVRQQLVNVHTLDRAVNKYSRRLICKDL